MSVGGEAAVGLFRAATAVSAGSRPADAPDTPATTWWKGSIHEGWDIAGNANGGYLLALAARAMCEAVGRPDPVTVTGHYLAPGRPGPVTVAVDVDKQGKTFGTASATLFAGDRKLLTAIGTLGSLVDDDVAAAQLVDRAPPEMPGPDDCIVVEATEAFPPPFMGKVELRLHPEDATFLGGNPSGHARMRGWFRLRDGEPIDTIAAICAADAFPPTVFNTHLPVAWTPTIELTAHLRHRPVPGWLRCQFQTHFVTGRFLEVDGDLWDGTDRLIVQSRQLALVPRG